MNYRLAGNQVKPESGPAIVIGISDIAVTTDPSACLVTYALGSCIAVAMNDPAARVGGLLHFLLPDSSLDTARGQSNPLMYADQGIPLLLEKVLQAGASKQRLVTRAVGGAKVLDDEGVFEIGKRNHVGMRKALWKTGLLLHSEATGGTLARSVRLEVGSGRLWVREGIQTARELVSKTERPERSVAFVPSSFAGR